MNELSLIDCHNISGGTFFTPSNHSDIDTALNFFLLPKPPALGSLIGSSIGSGIGSLAGPIGSIAGNIIGGLAGNAVGQAVSNFEQLIDGISN